MLIHVNADGKGFGGTMVSWYIPYVTKNHQRPIYTAYKDGTVVHH